MSSLLSKIIDKSQAFTQFLIKKILNALNTALGIWTLVILGILFYIFIIPDFYYLTFNDHEFRGEKVPPVGKILVLTRPVLSIDNLPLKSEAPDYIARNSYTRMKADSELSDLRSGCTNCIGHDRVITPIRITYLPKGTSFTVKKRFTMNYRGLQSIGDSSYLYVILEDTQGKTYEVSNISIDNYFENEFKHPRKKELEMINSQSKLLSMRKCIGLWESLKKFSDIFKFNSLEVELIEEESGACGTVNFKDIRAQNTYLFFKHEFTSFRLDLP